MLKYEKFLLSFAFLSFGMVLGFILSPIKKGMTVSCGNNNVIYPHGNSRRHGKNLPEEDPAPMPRAEEISEENL